MVDAAAPPPRDALRAAVVGVSESQTCGVHDHAALLSAALIGERVSCSEHWLWRRERSIAGARSEFQRWTGALPAELAAAEAEAAILHYSVFSYSYRGLPLFVKPTLEALRRSGLPLITILHEYVYPWGMGGAHGKAWALTQGARLATVMRASAAVVVTAPARGEWLASRPWLPRREIAFAPVFSNLPAPDLSQPRPRRADRVIGLFGYAYEGAAVSLVLDALRLLRDRGVSTRLQLRGAPGRESAAAGAWLAGARARGIEDALSFSGVLAAGDLSEALRGCDVLLHPEPSGPTSRKGTLAASLASGRPVVAIDGPRRWLELIDADVAMVVEPTAWALADGLGALLDDERRREALGARGGEFARTAMGVERSARVVAGLIDELTGASAR
jgi:glycosyltransferase involved in cell wall biosynthesis